MLSRDFKEFVALLNDHGVEYLVVGGYAMALHGRPRHTGDLDIWIRRSPENSGRLMVAPSEFGFGGVGLSQQDFELPQNVIQLGYPSPQTTSRARLREGSFSTIQAIRRS